jgi:multicomponent Na+:H+ antiporter subunit D
MIFANLPVLLVLIPIVAAAICTILPWKNCHWVVATFASLASFACAFKIFMQIYYGVTVIYPMGGWLAPYGIEYRIDKLSALFLLLVCVIGSFSVIYSIPSIKKEVAENQRKFFYAIYLLCFAGLLGVAATNDLFNMYIFFELSALASYALVAMGKDRRALVAAFEYLILGAVGAVLLLIAIGLVYSMTGSFNISDISIKIKPSLNTMPVKMALAFFIAALMLKMGVFPLHLWLINSYTNAPSFVAVFLGGAAVNIVVYVFIRITYGIFGYSFSYVSFPLCQILIFLGCVSILLASIVAILQDNIKRMLAYSSVAQIGYILLGIGMANFQSLSGALMQAVFHGVAKTAMFMAAGAVMFSVKDFKIGYFEGIGRLMPFTMAVFIISGLSLAGMPGTAGFIAKWYLLQGAILAGMWPVFVIIIISSLLTLIYVWRVVEVAFFEHVDASLGHVSEAPMLMLIPMLGMAASSIIFGIWPVYMNGYISQIVATLFGG